ncbi:MAG TPA: hypothetical protein VE890_02230, partial [Thermoguttaceae bacterium]|nr:hypothetical protein [Thermoguttaceae bacterium]
WIPLALNDNGIQVLMRRNEFGFGKSDELELWNIGSSGVSKGIKWIPYDSLERSDRDVSWAAFLDNGRVATVNGSGHLVVWDVDTARPIYRLSTASRGVPALSPDRKHLAFVAAGQIGVLDVAKGKVVALRRSPERSAFPRLCFSPSGARLAYKDAGKLYVWDFATGELSYEVSMKQFSGNEAILAPSEEHVLVRSNCLFDLKSGAKLWKYEGHALADSLGGICWFVLSERDKGPGALVPLVLPQPGVMETLEQAMADPDFLVLKPGVTVKLNVDGLPVAADREKARAQLTEKLSTLGFKVDSNGTIELVATLEFGEPEEISYRSFGFGFSGPPGSSSGTGKFRPYTFRLKFIYQEQTAWQTLGGQTSAPYSLDLKEGETIATALRRLEKPDYSFFERVELPESLMKPTGNSSGTLGSSSITAYGLE